MAGGAERLEGQLANSYAVQPVAPVVINGSSAELRQFEQRHQAQHANH